jgi:hypothetical protein
MPSPTIGSLLAPFVVAGADFGANWTVDHETTLIAQLQGYETKGVDALAADLESAIPTQSVEEKIVAPELRAAIRNLATELIGQLPALDKKAIDALVLRLQAIAASAAG